MVILEHLGLISEESIHLFETLEGILEEVQLLLEIPSYIGTFKNILEHFPFY